MLCFLAMYVHFLYVRPILVTLPPGISPIAVKIIIIIIIIIIMHY
jgi:hypothetical protein